jgi:hypothetical protein
MSWLQILSEDDYRLYLPPNSSGLKSAGVDEDSPSPMSPSRLCGIRTFGGIPNVENPLSPNADFPVD